MKSKLVCLGLLLCVCIPAWGENAPPVPNFSGSWNITGYLEPGLPQPGYTYCFDFTTTGKIFYSTSGTWNVPAYSAGWSGTWYQSGDELILHGVADGTYIFSWKGRLLNARRIAGRQVEFFIDGSTDSAGTFSGNKVSGCTGAAVVGKKDPAR
jgi:hypothetical protein